MLGLPLYEGVDWNSFPVGVGEFPRVSLFTREWIEIAILAIKGHKSRSLPLYEGVDWNLNRDMISACRSVSLFTREWIEISENNKYFLLLYRLPLYEGVDWNWKISNLLKNAMRSPSLRGSGLKFLFFFQFILSNFVSLFTREWIEIPSAFTAFLYPMSLPLYEGVDWNNQ